MSVISPQDDQLSRLAVAIAQRVGQQRFNVWFNQNSAKLDLRNDGLEIAVQNDFISDWIGKHFTRPIQEAAHEVLGCSLPVRFCVVPQLFEPTDGTDEAAPPTNGQPKNGAAKKPGAKLNGKSHGSVNGNGVARTAVAAATVIPLPPHTARPSQNRERADSSLAVFADRPRLRHDLSTFIVGPSNHLAHTACDYVSKFPGAQYNPLFIHGNCGLGKTHLLQGLCRRFAENHPTKRWIYLTGEEFTNEFLSSLRSGKIDNFRRKVRDLDLLAIDDVHFLSGKNATQEEFLHTFNAIEAMGRQVVIASDAHPRMIEEFGESLINRFVSGMVVRVDPPNFVTRCEILRTMSDKGGLALPEDVIVWIARRVTQNVRELEGAITRITAHVTLTGRIINVAMAQEALGDLDRQLVAPVKPENILASVCEYFGLDHKDLMSGRRQRTISLARSIAMFLIRKTAKLSFPEIGLRMGKRNHSTVISACRRIERAFQRNESLAWTSSIGEREEEASELIQRLEEHSRSLN